jgi:CCR4-NOT transcription complex subunit 2
MGPIQRNQPTPLSSQPEDLFSSSSRLTSNQGSFRFGNQGSVGQGSQPQPSSIDDFPPLNNGSFRNGSDEIGPERGSNMMSTLGFGAQASPAPTSLAGNRSGNGLLNALSANTRAAEVRSPDAASASGESNLGFPRPTTVLHADDTTQESSRPQDVRSIIGSEESRQKPPGFREDSLASQSSVQDTPAPSSESRNPFNHLGAIGNDAPMSKAKEEDKEDQPPAVHDPLAGMAPIDKWGIKGLRTLMNNYPDYSSAVTGVDPAQFGLSLQSPEYVDDERCVDRLGADFCLDCYQIRFTPSLTTQPQGLLFLNSVCRSAITCGMFSHSRTRYKASTKRR